MKAIVLSFDDQLGFVELLHKCYMEIWPDCPLTFMVPYQDPAARDSYDYFSGQANIEFRHSERAIHLSMQALLEGCDDSDWVFWCIDDRYPHSLHDRETLSTIHAAILRGDLGDRPGIKLARWREVPKSLQCRIGAYAFYDQRQAGMWGFWHHHFLRAGILREVFVNNPLPRPFRIRELNAYFHQARPLSVLDAVLLPADNIIDFAEPCWEGKLTANGARDLARHGCRLPDYEQLEDVRIFDKRWREAIEASQS